MNDIQNSSKTSRIFTDELKRDLTVFSLKAFILTYIIYLFLPSLPDVDQLNDLKVKLQKQFRNEQARIQLTGLLTTNPYVFWRVSEIMEQKGDIERAIEQMQLAIGLFELHPSDKEAKQRYAARLKELQKKAASGTQQKIDHKDRDINAH